MDGSGVIHYTIRGRRKRRSFICGYYGPDFCSSKRAQKCDSFTYIILVYRCARWWGMRLAIFVLTPKLPNVVIEVVVAAAHTTITWCHQSCPGHARSPISQFGTIPGHCHVVYHHVMSPVIPRSRQITHFLIWYHTRTFPCTTSWFLSHDCDYVIIPYTGSLGMSGGGGALASRAMRAAADRAP